MDGELLTVQQLKERLKVSLNTAYLLCKQPGFPACRIGRRVLVPADQLKEWIDRGGTSSREGRRA